MARPHRPSYFGTRKCWRFMLNGKRIYFSKGIPPDERPARDGIPRRVWDAMDALVRAADERGRASSDPTVFWLVQTYLDWCEAEATGGKIGVKQYQNRRCHLAHLLDHPGFRDIRPVLLSAETMDGFFARFASTPLGARQGLPSAHYVHNVGRSVRAMFRWAARPVAGRLPVRLVHPNPLDGYSFPRQPGAVRGYLEGSIVRRFLRWAWAQGRAQAGLRRRFDRIFVLMLRFQRLTGCRPGEACGLEWSEVMPPPPVDGSTWSPALITIRPEKVKTRKQTDRARKIHVTRPVARILRALRALPGRHEEFVFTHMRGTGAEGRGHLSPDAGEPWPDGSAASKKVAALRRDAIRAGLAGVVDVGPIKLIAYANRHGYASEGSSLGFSDEQVAEQLGNTPETMRRVYAHSIDEAAAERARRISEGRRKKPGRV